MQTTVKDGTAYQDQTLAYDALGRLRKINALDGITVTRDYDALGNILHQTVSCPHDPQPQAIRSRPGFSAVLLISRC